MSVTEKIGLSTLTVAYTGKVYSVEERAKRPYYTVTITTPQWQYVDNTLSGGCDEKADERKAFGSLLSFLTACSEIGCSSTLFSMPLPAHTIGAVTTRIGCTSTTLTSRY